MSTEKGVYAKYAEKPVSDQILLLSQWIEHTTGYEVDERSVYLTRMLGGKFQKTDENREFRAARADRVKAAAEERRAQREAEREAKKAAKEAAKADKPKRTRKSKKSQAEAETEDVAPEASPADDDFTEEEEMAFSDS